MFETLRDLCPENESIIAQPSKPTLPINWGVFHPCNRSSLLFLLINKGLCL
jgi:hypothetical protein